MKRSNALDYFGKNEASKAKAISDNDSDDSGSDDDVVSLASVVAYGIILRAPADLDSRRREMLNDPAVFQKKIESAINLKYEDVQIGFEEISSNAINSKGQRSASKINFGLFIYIESKASWIEESRDPSACGLFERINVDRLVLTSREKSYLCQAARDIHQALFGRPGPASYPGSRDPNGIDLCHVLCL